MVILLLTVAGTIATCIACVFAYWQYLEVRRQKHTELERIAMQRERLHSALTAALAGVETADLIVQRTKDPDVSFAELGNVARVLRGNLAHVARQLHGQDQVLRGWQVGAIPMLSDGKEHEVGQIPDAEE